MEKKFELVNFNLTKEMLEYLIKFSNLKKELSKLKVENSLTDDKIIKIKNIENEMNEIKIIFIKEFRGNNKEEIKKYLQIKDQK